MGAPIRGIFQQGLVAIVKALSTVASYFTPSGHLLQNPVWDDMIVEPGALAPGVQPPTSQDYPVGSDLRAWCYGRTGADDRATGKVQLAHRWDPATGGVQGLEFHLHVGVRTAPLGAPRVAALIRFRLTYSLGCIGQVDSVPAAVFKEIDVFGRAANYEDIIVFPTIIMPAAYRQESAIVNFEIRRVAASVPAEEYYTTPDVALKSADIHFLAVKLGTATSSPPFTP